MTTFRDGPPTLGGNGVISGPERERLAREHEAAQRQRITGKADEQKFLREKFYAEKRKKLETP